MRRTVTGKLGLLCLLVLLAPHAAAARQSMAAEEPARWETQHTMQLRGERISYDAVFGSILLRDGRDEPTGALYYTAYFRTGVPDPASRPIIFTFNGGPGSASFWLHMGIMGPRRIVTPELGSQGPPPYRLESNQYTLLDMADLVMIDPIGTGFSRPLGDTPGTDFWGIDEDAASLTEFIRRFLSEYQRWNAPRYLLGESYGTTRSAVLARHLQGANIDLNGIVLVSAVLDFQTIQFPPQAVVPYVLNLPSYALIAAYHDALPGGAPADLDAWLREVEDWSMTEYATTLLAGGVADPARRAAVVRQMSRYTGLSPEYIERAGLRVTPAEFRQELLRDRGLHVGRLDARFTGPLGDALDRTPSHDATLIGPAYIAAFNTYLRAELGYDGHREYRPSGGTRPWNWTRQSDTGRPNAPNVAPDLAEAIRRNPRMEVLLINGVYDLATPYFAAVWTMDQLGLPPELRARIHRSDFDAGHMMYVREDLLPQWREVLADFVRRTSAPGPRPTALGNH